MRVDHFKSFVMWTPRNLKLSNRSPFPVVHNQHLSLIDVEGEVVFPAPHCQVTDILPLGCLIIVVDQAYHRCVISKLDDDVLLSHAFMGEYRKGLSTHPCGGPVLRVSLVEVMLPTFNTWGRPVRKSKIQLQREVFSPRVLSFVTSLDGTMLLNAECSQLTAFSRRYSSYLGGCGQCGA